MTTVIQDVVTWLKQWFYTESEIDTITGGLQSQINNKAEISELNSKASATHTHGNLQNDGKVGTSSNASKNVVTDANGYLTVEEKYSHPSTHATTIIKEGSALANIGTSANATQHTINDAINTAIGNLSSIKAVQVIDTKPTASSSTMDKLYIVNENNKVNVYYTKQTGTGSSATYSWQKMDTDILDELSIDWTDIQNKPTTFTPSDHAHGNITKDGKVGSNSNYFVTTTTSGLVTSKQKIGNITTSGAIGTAADKPLITTTSGVLTTGTFGTGSGEFAEGNHTHSDYMPKPVNLDSSTDNVDNIIQSGYYVLNDNIAISGTLPISNKAFTLMVDGDSKTVRQILTYYKAQNRTFVRMYSGWSSNLGWSDWKELATVDSLNSMITANQVASVTLVPKSTDANGKIIINYNSDSS